MASDDGLANNGGDEETSEHPEKPRSTMRGVGVKVSSPPDPPDSRRKDDEFEEFEVEATEIADSLADDMIEDIDRMLDPEVDRGWDELAEKTRTGGFIAVDDEEARGSGPPAVPADASDELEDDFDVGDTEIAVSSLEFPEDERRAEGQTFADAVGEGGEGLSGLSLDEDSLPTPIHEKTPTLDEHPSEQNFTVDPTNVSAPSGPQPGVPPDQVSQAPPNDVPHRGDPAQEGNDFDGEQTELLDSPFESEPAVAKLATLDGPASGQEFFASGLRNTIGRGVNNSVVVADLAMSRQHFEIVKNPDETFTLRDLQSVNGTVLNGTKIREADLMHGDRIVAGKSTFQFVVSGGGVPSNRQRRVVPAGMSTVAGSAQNVQPAPADPASKSESVNRLIVWVSLGAALVSLLLIAGIVLLMASKKDPEDTASAQQPTASQVYLEGVEAVRTRDWETARARFERAEELDPSLDGIDDQLRRIEIERQAAEKLEHARELASAGDYGAVRETVDEIPRDSVYYSDAMELLRDGRNSEIERKFVAAQEALTNEDLERSGTLVDEILAEVPTHQGARELRERIESVREGEDTVEQVAAATAEAVEKREKRRKTRRRRRPRNDSDDESADDLFALVESDEGGSDNEGSSRKSRVPNFVEGYMLYKTRKFDRAYQFFNDAADGNNPASSLAEKIAGNIKEFEQRYNKGTDAFKSGNWRVAERELIAAKRADSAIASGDGYFDRELSTKLATVKANLGLSALNSGGFAKARRYHGEARSFNANDPAVKKLGAALEKKAASLWVKARHLQKKDRAKAAEYCRDIMQLVPEGHSSHTKARDLLQAL